MISFLNFLLTKFSMTSTSAGDTCGSGTVSGEPHHRKHLAGPSPPPTTLATCQAEKDRTSSEDRLIW